MGKSEDRRTPKASELIGRCAISCFSVVLSQFAILIVPRYFPASAILTQLSLSALLLVALTGFGRCCKQLLRVTASAPAFVFFNILFIWLVYFAIVRQAIGPSADILLHSEFSLLVLGVYRMMFMDPGFVEYRSSCFGKLENTVSEAEAHTEDLAPLNHRRDLEQPTEENSNLGKRVRYCRICKAYVKGFDHHCPAFGNCIGQKNHVLFMVLLVGFIIAEASYISCSSQFARKTQMLDRNEQETTRLTDNLAVSTMLFSVLQVLWQVFFLTWHIYCVCFNIKTDEWINWRKYPEFRIDAYPDPEQIFMETHFTNPYDKGILHNWKEFLSSQE